MNEQLISHFKIWATVGIADFFSTGLDEYNVMASIFMHFCGGLASLSVAYIHIKNSKKRK